MVTLGLVPKTIHKYPQVCPRLHISGKISRKIQLVVKLPTEILLALRRGLCFPNDFRNLVGDSLAQQYILCPESVGTGTT